MNLNLAQIEAVTSGAQRITEEADGIHFYRFNEAQTAFYGDRSAHVPNTAGVALRFRTDSTALYLKIGVSKLPKASRSYFAVDVFQNGAFLGDIRNFEETELMRKYTLMPLPLGEFEKEFALCEGEKELCIHLPWNLITVLKELRLDDGASLVSAKREKKLLCFGDSISQGFDALHPSRRYTARVADYLGMSEYNLAIGGEMFRPTLAAIPTSFTPDRITVAYGTNDWRHRTVEEFDESCRLFYKNLRETYPDTPILAIAPLWRKIADQVYECGPFRSLYERIKAFTSDLPNVTVVDGYDLIPHFSDYFADLTLHPNGAGYDRYFEGLIPYLK
ncbi:MAG: SGNH/GDSL hydrolase family protein [Clostridia bacterium]|nr:SGNH/GDSL hydrolase family protein [Clostridia bacterium]